MITTVKRRSNRSDPQSFLRIISTIDLQLKRFKEEKYILVPILAPILVIAITDFRSLFAIWNQGRGGFLIALSFLALEFFDSKIRMKRTFRRNLVIVLITLVTSVYFGSTLLFGVHDWLSRVGEGFGVTLLPSWVIMWDYVVFSAFLLIILAVRYGVRELRSLFSANVYLTGMAVILSLDALFPFDTLGPLQAIVPLLLGGVRELVTLFQLGQIGLTENILTLYGSAGTFSFAVFWPSAGVHSMIIYSLIMLIFLLKLDISTFKKIIFLSAGIIGTFAVNVFRIFLLAAYVLTVSTNPARFEEFHNVAGEIVFLPWIMGYIFFIYRLAR